LIVKNFDNPINQQSRQKRRNMMIFEKVKKIIADQLNVEQEKVKPETSLIKDLEADSLDAVEIIMTLEEEFKVEIPDSDAEEFSNVGDIVKYIEKKLA